MTEKNVSENYAVDRRTFLRVAGGAAAGLTAFGLSDAIGDPVERVTAAATRKAARVVAFGQPDRTADVYRPLIAGAQAEARRRGYQLLESFANSQADKQIAEIGTWIGEQVDAMTILPLDVNAMGGLIHRAHSAGVKFVSYSVELPGADGYILFDNRQGSALVGQYAGQWVNKTLGGKAEVALLTFDVNANGRQRVHGGLAALQKVAPGTKVVAQTQAVLAPDAFKATQSILQAHPNVNVILCIADDGCLGAAQAFKATGRDPKTMFIAGWDGSRQVMQKILDGGPIRATGALDLKAIGASAVWVPANIVEGKGPRFFNSPYVLVTHETPTLARRLIKNFGS